MSNVKTLHLKNPTFKQYHFFVDMGPDNFEILMNGTSEDDARSCVLTSLASHVKEEIRNIELVKSTITHKHD